MFLTSEQAQGWLLCAVSGIGDDALADPVAWLAAVIGQGDYAAHAIFDPEEMQEGARRLLDRGLLAIRQDGFTLGLTSAGRALCDTTAQANPGPVDMILALTSWCQEHAAPPPSSTWTLDEQLHQRGLDRYYKDVGPSPN